MPGHVMKTMTIRNVSSDIATALDAEMQRRGLSLNRTVLALLREALGISGTRSRGNGLAGLAGTWSKDEYREFEQTVAAFGEIDEDLWK